MEVHFTPEQEAQLAEIAMKVGTDPEHFVKDAVLRCSASLPPWKRELLLLPAASFF